MDRRGFLGVTALGLLVRPRAAEAQAPARVFRIGLLGGSPPTSPEAAHVWAAFFQGLRELGYVEGRNVVIEGRWYGDNIERLPALAAELVRLPVDVIVAGAAPAPEAARRATSTIPIVLSNHSDPVASGLVASLARPGGNVTGSSIALREVIGKQLQLLKEVVPGLQRIAVLTNPDLLGHELDVRELDIAARALAVGTHLLTARGPGAFADAFAAATKERVGALFILRGGSMFFAHRGRLAELAARSRLPAMSPLREYVQAGGLMSYGVDVRDTFRRAASYVDRILRGAKPADLPVEQPTKFELVINLKTAKTLGLTIPPAVLARADQVIE
jgi:putative ABC transport system substrate-binding protein